MTPRILIKHLTGSKANQIEQFQLEGTHALIIGRGGGADIAFDGRTEGTVSRRHAVIDVLRSDQGVSFSISDLGSRNGTLLNGRRVMSEQNLLPGDVVELGPQGPTFKIAVEPRSLCAKDGATTRPAPVSHGTDDTTPNFQSVPSLRMIGPTTRLVAVLSQIMPVLSPA